MKKIILTIALIITSIFVSAQEYDDVYYNPKKDTVTVNNVTNNYYTIDWNFGYSPMDYHFSWYNVYTPYYGYYTPYYFYEPIYFYPYYNPYYYSWNYHQPYWYHHHHYNWNYYNHHNNYNGYYGPRKSIGSYSIPPKNIHRQTPPNIRTVPKYIKPTDVKNTKTSQPQRYSPPEYRDRRNSQEYTSPKYRNPQENNGKTPVYWRDFNDMSKPAPTIERQRPQSNERINRSPVNPSPQRNNNSHRR